MKAPLQIAIVLVCICPLALHAEPTPRPSAAQRKAVVSRQQTSEHAGATGVFVLQLRPDGSVDKVLIARSTGNQNIDAWTAKGLSAMRFPPEQLTKTELANDRDCADYY